MDRIYILYISRRLHIYCQLGDGRWVGHGVVEFVVEFVELWWSVGGVRGASIFSFSLLFPLHTWCYYYHTYLYIEKSCSLFVDNRTGGVVAQSVTSDQ